MSTSLTYIYIYTPTHSLHINCKIWQNTPNSLIDFESDENISLITTVHNGGYLYKKASSLNFISSENELQRQRTGTIDNTKPKPESSLPSPHNGTFICKVTPRKDIYEIELNDTKSSHAYDIDDIPWIISRYVFNDSIEHGYRIHEGDLLKLGKFILKIRQIRFHNDVLLGTMVDKERNTKYEDEDLSRNAINSKDVGYMKDSIIKPNVLVLNQSKIAKREDEMCKHNSNTNKHSSCTLIKDKPTCRICLSDDYDDNSNPLINPCKCAGTMKYLHLECLRQLVKSKVQTTVHERVTVLTFKTLECDICKSPFPEHVKVKHTTYTVIDLNRPHTNYVIIEGIVRETPDVKSIFVVNFNDVKTIKIGRASDADLRLSDISVSRSHAQMMLIKGQLVLVDTKSKFGTLVNAGNKLCVLPYKSLAVQKGNIFLKLNMKLTWCALLSCYRPKQLPYGTYNSFFDSTVNNKCVIKDVPNFLWTDTQIVSEFDSVRGEEGKWNLCMRNSEGHEGNGGNNSTTNVNGVSGSGGNNNNDNTMDNNNGNSVSGAWDSRNITEEITNAVGESQNQGEFRW